MAHHYSIFLDEARNLLFGYVEIESEERWDAVANTGRLPALVAAYGRCDAEQSRS
ncbi:L-rhamnose mutarotase [Serratia fonticola]|uniref:L-rhamnose mutarotase n=1 Tax=Serratia fonticola TaxID=47917 RepID=A0A4U9TL96_SERFO|nr:L-rhamnose mutarotase [Serratia fonticola]